MTTYDTTLDKISQLPESLVQEVSDFIDFLILKQSREFQQIAGSDFSEYLQNLEAYEESLARGEIKW